MNNKQNKISSRRKCENCGESFRNKGEIRIWNSDLSINSDCKCQICNDCWEECYANEMTDCPVCDEDLSEWFFHYPLGE